MKCAACRFADGVLKVQRSQALCRPCGGNLSRFLLSASASTLAAVWNRAPPPPSSDDGHVFEEFKTLDVEAVFEQFKAQVKKTIGKDDTRAWLDLADAYAEMGLASDVVSAAAHALSPETPQGTAQRSIDLIFGANARPDALDYVLRLMRMTS
jgi:hypothetical protein